MKAAGSVHVDTFNFQSQERRKEVEYLLQGVILWKYECGSGEEICVRPRYPEQTKRHWSSVCCEEGEEGVTHVDLDQADFGFCVGEIEVLVPDGKEVQSALKKIQRTAERLGLSGDRRIQGKMDAYLQRYCPEHYRKLLNAHVL
ncbi:hypothetical protein MATL_G00036550 [Megalops atlanticus]|uniref:CYTH domain-containing protein n=1 Tax=Megalops atlanticus TaxID=7932 RepID=A0A9D3QI32_MEGAT|nr:hypothetical protein MATL_G00036550 [Megalops atlanticus]